ncbi:hypothetical protein [Alicyclobacillus tolerans]
MRQSRKLIIIGLFGEILVSFLDFVSRNHDTNGDYPLGRPR